MAGMEPIEDEEHEDHESYVTVGFSRRNGNPGRLFGSSIKTHESYITLKVSKATRIHSLGSDRFYGSMNGDVIEVDLSAAQFCELLTTMNVGSGVPGTLRRVFDRQVESPPDSDLEVEKIRKNFSKSMGKLAADCKAHAKKAEELLTKKGGVNAAEKNELLDALRKVMMAVESNAPFMLHQFEEATEKVVTSAKAEIDAFATHQVVEAGIQALQARASQPTIPELPPTKSDDK